MSQGQEENPPAYVEFKPLVSDVIREPKEQKSLKRRKIEKNRKKATTPENWKRSTEDLVKTCSDENPDLRDNPIPLKTTVELLDNQFGFRHMILMLEHACMYACSYLGDPLFIHEFSHKGKFFRICKID